MISSPVPHVAGGQNEAEGETTPCQVSLGVSLARPSLPRACPAALNWKLARQDDKSSTKSGTESQDHLGRKRPPLAGLAEGDSPACLVPALNPVGT